MFSGKFSPIGKEEELSDANITKLLEEGCRRVARHEAEMRWLPDPRQYLYCRHEGHKTLMGVGTAQHFCAHPDHFPPPCPHCGDRVGAFVGRDFFDNKWAARCGSCGRGVDPAQYLPDYLLKK